MGFPKWGSEWVFRNHDPPEIVTQEEWSQSIFL